MKKVLITGATGYIGSHLARTLLFDCEVYCLVREPLKLEYIKDIQAQLRLLPYDGSYESMEAAVASSCPDMVYHLATYYTGSHDGEHIKKLLDSNLIMGLHLLEAMSVYNIPALVYTTTVTTCDEKARYQPLTLYAATKHAFSDLVEYYTWTGAFKAVSVMLSDTYGPGDQRPKVLNLVRQSILKNQPIALTSGRQIFDAVYIDDVVQGLVRAGESLACIEDVHVSFQLASVQPRSLRDTVELMLRINGLMLQANWGELADPKPLLEQPLRIAPLPPGWQPKVSLEKGLRKFWTEVK